MTKKRFELIEHNTNPFWIIGIKDNETGNDFRSLQDVLVLLNELNHENRQLQKKLEMKTEANEYHKRMLMKWCVND